MIKKFNEELNKELNKEFKKGLKTFQYIIYIYGSSVFISELSNFSFFHVVLFVCVLILAGFIVHVKSKIIKIELDYKERIERVENRLQDNITFETNMRKIGDILNSAKISEIALDGMDRNYEVKKLSCEINKIKDEQTNFLKESYCRIEWSGGNGETHEDEIKII